MRIAKRNLMPCLIAMLAGGCALARMSWVNGFSIFTKWYFFPSLAVFVAMAFYLCGIGSPRSGGALWRFIQWWSGVWTVFFFLAFAAPPFSPFIILYIAAPMLDSARIDPFSAGFVHLMVWACASDILKNHRPKSEAQPQR